jgi:hypothetical protein
MSRSTRIATTAAALVIALLPAMAKAQIAVRHGPDGPFGDEPIPVVPVNVAKAIIENDKDMALSDSQRVQLVLIRKQLDSLNAPLFARLDSVRPSWRPAGGLNDLSQEQRDQLVTQRKAQNAVIALMTPNFAKARERVLAVLTPEQQERANKIEKNARKRAEEAARREFETKQVYGQQRRRGEILDGTGRAPLD